MSYLDDLAKNFISKQKKQKIKKIKCFATFAMLGVAIGGTIVLFKQSCCEEIRNIVIKNAANIDESIDESIDENINIKRNEIKQTLETVSDESKGDIGVAMKNAFENLEDEKQNGNENKKE